MAGLWADVADLADCGSFAEQNRALGYEGMAVIHPSHVPVVNEVFAPDAEELARCGRLIAAVERAQAEGAGAVLFEGRMESTRRWRQRPATPCPATVGGESWAATVGGDGGPLSVRRPRELPRPRPFPNRGSVPAPVPGAPLPGVPAPARPDRRAGYG